MANITKSCYPAINNAQIKNFRTNYKATSKLRADADAATDSASESGGRGDCVPRIINFTRAE